MPPQTGRPDAVASACGASVSAPALARTLASGRGPRRAYSGGCGTSLAGVRSFSIAATNACVPGH